MRELCIVGGGVAGLSLGIGLRLKGVPVTLVEAGRYPRHRVCGEFISGEGLGSMSRLGIETCILEVGTCLARTGLIAHDSRSSPIREFPQPGLCISRFALDAAMAREFLALGGRLETGRRMTASGKGIVQATGRVPCRGRREGQWFGLKAHVMGAELEADLELHLVPSGYVGLCRLKDGVVNVCGLYRSGAGAISGRAGWVVALKGAEGSLLRRRLERARFLDGSLCAVGGLGFGKKQCRHCAIGDSFSVIPPATGNGMSMAMESAELAVEPLLAFSRGDWSWQEAHRAVRIACEQRFSRRLRWGRWLHFALVSKPMQTSAGVLLNSDRLWKLFLTRTRDVV